MVPPIIGQCAGGRSNFDAYRRRLVPGHIKPSFRRYDRMIVTAENQPPTYIYTWTLAVAEGAGNPVTGWNPAGNWIQTIPLETWA